MLEQVDGLGVVELCCPPQHTPEERSQHPPRWGRFAFCFPGTSGNAQDYWFVSLKLPKAHKPPSQGTASVLSSAEAASLPLAGSKQASGVGGDLIALRPQSGAQPGQAYDSRPRGLSIRRVRPAEGDTRISNGSTAGNVGYPKLREHLGSVVAIMKLGTDWYDFRTKLDKLHPRYGKPTQLSLEFADDDEPDTGKGL